MVTAVMNDGTSQDKANPQASDDQLIVVLPFGTRLPLSRRSIHTGEFWLVVAVLVAITWLETIGKLPGSLATLAQVVMSLGLAWARNQAKEVGGVQIIEALESAKGLPAPVVSESVLRHTAEIAAEFEAAKADAAAAPGVVGAKIAPLLVLAAMMLSSCGTVVKEQGRTVFYTPANARHVDFKSPRGSRLVIDDLDHAVVHKAVGSAVANGAAGTGAAVATSGLLGIFH